jgi:hypothetical protein
VHGLAQSSGGSSFGHTDLHYGFRVARMAHQGFVLS